MGDIEQLIPKSCDGVLKNLAEVAEEHRNGNIECLMLCYRRKKGGHIRTFFIGASDPHMFRTLERLKHDILGIYADDVVNVVEYFDGNEET